MAGVRPGTTRLPAAWPLASALCCLLSQRAGACELGYQTSAPGAAVLAGEPVVFQAQGAAPAAPDSDSAAYRFRFDGDGAEAALLSAEEARLSRTFERVGSHVATVYCRPAPHDTANSSGTVVPQAFWPLARVHFDVLATGTRSCYEYRVEQLHIAQVDTTADERSQTALVVSVWDRSEPTPARAASLTAQFLTMRAAPHVQLASMTKTGPASVRPVHGLLNTTSTLDGWQIVVPDVYVGPMDATLELQLSPPAGLLLMGCSIASSTAHVSRTHRSLPYSSVYAAVDIQVSAEAINHSDGSEPQQHVTNATLVQNPCRPSELTLVVQAVDGRLSLLLSNDLGNDLQLTGAAGSFTRVSDVAAWLCGELEASGTLLCPITRIYSVTPMVRAYHTEMLLSTREGLMHFIAATPTRSSATASIASLTNLSSAVGADIQEDLRISMTTPTPCVELLSSLEPCVYLISPRAQRSPSVWSTCSDLHHQWHHQTFSPVASVVCGSQSDDCMWQIDAAVRDFHRRADVYLASASGSSLTLVSVSKNDYAADDATSTALGLQPGFVFAASEGACDDAVFNMILHSNGHEFLAYGRQIWASADGGYAFHRLATLPDRQIAVQVVTTTFQSGFAVVTQTKEVYYGRTGVAHLAAVVSLLAHYHAPIVHWTPTGTLVAFDIGCSNDCSTNQQAVSIHSLVRLPVDESVVSDDWSFESALIPSWFVGSIDVWCGDGVRCFSEAYIGRRIIMKHGGSVQIVEVINGTSASGMVVDPLEPEHQPTVRAQLHLSRMYVVESDSKKAPVECDKWTATLSEADGSGWRFHDRGKTLMTRGLSRVDRQSYLVSDLINGTHAILTRYSNACADYRKINSTVVERDMWGMYDLRGYTEARTTYEDRLCLKLYADTGQDDAASILAIPLQAPAFVDDYTNASTSGVTLEEIMMPMMPGATHLTFLTEDGTDEWGLIHALSENEAESFGPQGFQLQLAYWPFASNTTCVSKWSAFAVDAVTAPTNTLLPTFQKQRPWKLAVPPCDSGDINDAQASTRPTALFDSAGGGQWLGSMVRFIDLNQRVDFHVLPQHAAAGLKVTRMHPRAVHSSVVTYGTHNNNADVVAAITLVSSSGLSNHGSSIIHFAPLPLAPDSSAPAASLRCSIGAQTAIMFAGCQPNTQLVHAETTGRWLLRESTSLAPEPSGRWTTVRKNYRPPSALGRAVPTTDNIYNADPAVPREVRFERYAASRNSGRFKHCLDKPSREACGCPASTEVAAQLSQLDVTDCVEEVFTVHFSVPFVPRLVVIPDSVESLPSKDATPLNVRYELEELNGRTDFCVNSTADGVGCQASTIDSDRTGDSATHKLVLDPGANDALIWRGGELYHFRATVTDASSASLCEMETEFIVYVDALSMQPAAQYLVMSSTAMACVLAILLVYVSTFSLVEL